MDPISAENTYRLKPLNELSKYNNYYFYLWFYPAFSNIGKWKKCFGN